MKDSKLLKKSIRHWEDILKEAEKDEQGLVSSYLMTSVFCPLCKKYLKLGGHEYSLDGKLLHTVKCGGCPIEKHSGFTDGVCCLQWQDAIGSMRRHEDKKNRLMYVSKMIEYLKEVLDIVVD